MDKIRAVLGFDMETDIGSWTSSYQGFHIGTERILKILDRYSIPATFFFTADAARKNRADVLAVRRAGHEIGCHTLYHETIGDPLFEIPGMIPILPEEVEHRIELATEQVAEAAGVAPSSFRCPRLWGSTRVVNALERLGYRADVSYPMYFYREQLTPYHPSAADWTKQGNLKLWELPNFADLSMESHDPYGRDLDQWPLWRTENTEAMMKHVRGYCGFCEKRNVAPFLCFYAHPWEFAEMPSGLIHSGEGAVLPDPFIIKNCGEYSAREFGQMIEMLLDFGAEFHTAAGVVEA